MLPGNEAEEAAYLASLGLVEKTDAGVSDASAHIDLHLAEAERQEEDMDESIYAMESDPSASPSQESNGSVASADGSDCLKDQYYARKQ